MGFRRRGKDWCGWMRDGMVDAFGHDKRIWLKDELS